MSSELRNAGERNPICNFFEDASFWKRVSIGTCYKTIADVDYSFGDRTPAGREYTHSHADSASRIYVAIPGRTLIGPVFQVHEKLFLGTHETEIQIPSTTTPKLTSWVVKCRGNNRHVDELHLRDPGHNPTSTELPLERSIAKESELCFTETHANQFDIPTNPVYHSKEVFLDE